MHSFQPDRRRLLPGVFLILALACSGDAWAQCETQYSAHLFAGFSGSILPTPGQSNACHPTINRVVGPGTPSDFDSQGFLTNWPAYVANGVLSAQAWVTVLGFFEPDGSPLPDGIYNVTI